MYFPEDVWAEIKQFRFYMHLWNEFHIKMFNKSINKIKNIRSLYIHTTPYMRQSGDFYKVVYYISFGQRSIIFIEEIFLKKSYNFFDDESMKVLYG